MGPKSNKTAVDLKIIEERPSFSEWLAELPQPTHSAVLEKIQVLRNGDWSDVIRIEENLYEVRVPSNDIIFIYFHVGSAGDCLTLVSGCKIPRS